MKNNCRPLFRLVAGLASLCASGCAYTTVGSKLGPITPPRPDFQPSVEHTVGDFSFTLEGGKMVTSNFVGRTLNESIMGSWKDHGYIRDAKSVESGAFSGKADYQVTLSGSQYGESSVAMQLLCGLTLFLVPYTVTQSYDIQYTLQDVAAAKTYSASVQESNKTYVELFLLVTLPFAARNQNAMLARMGDHLYDQLYRQGAFRRTAAAAALP